MASIIVTIGKTGEVKMEGKGFTGTACHEAMKPYASLLGEQRSAQDHLDAEQSEIRVGGE